MKPFYNKVGTNEILTGNAEPIGTIADEYIQATLDGLNGDFSLDQNDAVWEEIVDRLNTDKKELLARVDKLQKENTLLAGKVSRVVKFLTKE